MFEEEVGKVKVEKPKFLSTAVLTSLQYASWISMTGISIGLIMGFLSSALIHHIEGSHIFNNQPEKKPPFVLPLPTILQDVCITSSVTLTIPAGALVSAILKRYFGRRFMMVVCHLPLFIGWLCITFALSCNTIIIGQLINGLGIGIAYDPTFDYLHDISIPKLRGAMRAIPHITLTLGMAIQATVGSIVHWRIMALIGLVSSIVLVGSNAFLPESPYFLVVNNDVVGARDILTKLRGPEYNVEEELQNIIGLLSENDTNRLSLKEKFKYLKKPSCFKPLSVILGLVLLKAMTGSYTLLFWSHHFTHDSNVEWFYKDYCLSHPTLCYIRFIGIFAFSLLSCRYGWRRLIIISSFGMSLFLLVQAMCATFVKTKGLLQFYSIAGHTFFVAAGLEPIPQILVHEIFPIEMKSILAGIVVFLKFWIITLCTAMYPIHLVVGWPVLLYMYGISAFIGGFLLWRYFPETKGLSPKEIVELFGGARTMPSRHVTFTTSSNDFKLEPMKREEATMDEDENHTTMPRSRIRRKPVLFKNNLPIWNT